MPFSLPKFALAICLFGLLLGQGCKKAAPNAVASPYSLDFKCQACGHEFAHEWSEIEKMKKEGNVVIPEGELMNVLCPACGEIKGRDADPRVGL